MSSEPTVTSVGWPISAREGRESKASIASTCCSQVWGGVGCGCAAACSIMASMGLSGSSSVARPAIQGVRAFRKSVGERVAARVGREPQ